ncbi:phage integrase N-terminal domain-containing protein [Methylotenera sp.]|uniref:phage integrase N-terminal domain-containing protein n=1 Tax=Methylotenera sp. TaxID=2051956 RepID=UPI002EDB27AA
MRDLNYQLKKLCERNRDGSHSTQANRERRLSLVANQLHGLGFRNLRIENLKPKHIHALVNHWQLENLSSGTVKNRMSDLRWVAEKLNIKSVIANDNSHYKIEKRVYVTNISKATALDHEKLTLIADEHIKLSLKLQEQFGLRREESIKFNVSWADRGDRIVLKSSWTKGGKERAVPIRNEAQRQLLKQIKDFARNESLIPNTLTYIQQLKRFEDHTAKAGIHKVHGFRHAYAQQRYLELTTQLSPAAGGKSSKELTKEEKIIDREVRLIISKELGHEREQVTAIYLGR